MATSSSNPFIADLVDATLAVAAGVGIVTLALFPLAIPMLAVTAVALIPLLIPLLLLPLAGGLIAAPFLLLRQLFRRAAVPVKEKKDGKHRHSRVRLARRSYRGPRRRRGLVSSEVG